MRYRKGKRYNYKNWMIGDRVRANPEFSWGEHNSHKWNREGTVTHIDPKTLKVLWDDRIDCYYSYACSSLINVSKKLKIDLLPDSLFEI